MTPTRQSIMNAQGNHLISIIGSFLQEIDNLSQLAADKDNIDLSNEFGKEFLQMEQYYLLSKINLTMRDTDRNKVRISMKHCLKLSAILDS